MQRREHENKDENEDVGIGSGGGGDDDEDDGSHNTDEDDDDGGGSGGVARGIRVRTHTRAHQVKYTWTKMIIKNGRNSIKTIVTGISSRLRAASFTLLSHSLVLFSLIARVVCVGPILSSILYSVMSRYPVN